MEDRWTVGRKLFAGIGVLIVLLVALGAFSLWSASVIEGRLDETGLRTAKRIELVGRVQLASFILFGAEKIMILAGFDNDRQLHDLWKQRLDSTYTDVVKDVEKLRGLMRVESGKQAAAKLSQGFAAWKDVHDEVAALIAAGRFHEAQQLSLSKSRPIVEANEAAAATIAANQSKFLATDMKEAETAYAQSRATALVVMAVALAIAALVIVSVVGINKALRTTAVELRVAAEEVVAASGHVASSAQSLSQGATEQAASLEETSASMEEMAAKTRTTAGNARQVATLVTGMTQQVESSNQALGDMVTSMSAIEESSNKVAKIIKTIDEIAFQTNILALNAAVEAARAGEAGMGFAVVADEVRSLAQRSAQAAKDTKHLIDESIARSQNGSAKVEQVAAAIRMITETVAEVRGIVAEVHEASQQQTQGIDHVSQATAEMEKVTQTTAATAEQSAAASEELNAQAEASMAAVQRLERMVGATNASRGASPGHHRVEELPRAIPMRRKLTPVRTAPPIPFNKPLGPRVGTGTDGSF